jgi:hypothetical protein
MSYQTTRNTRRESRTLVGRFRGGKLAPVMAVPVRGNEGGMLAQSITLELDGIAGRMITPITGEFISVFVPVQAIDEIKDPAAAYPGMTEVLREKLLSGNPLFGLENETEISKRCGVNPRSIGGVKKVNEMVRLAHNAAVNHLRRRKYVKATQLLAASTAITPALISQTVLERLNGVLDPDDRINGSVQLDIPDMQLPVGGMVAGGNVSGTDAAGLAMRGVTAAQDYTTATGNTAQMWTSSSGLRVKMAGTGTSARPDVFAALNGAVAGNVSLVDFYNAETKDRLTREMEKIITDFPEHGEEMVLRWAHGLSVDMGKTPQVIHEDRRQFGRSIASATDWQGIQGEIMRSDMMLQMSFSVPVPRTELGGVVITFACLKPDETLASQPHPILSDVWGVDNFVADELALDPVPVTIRELDSDCTAGQESTVALYTGLNSLKALYVHYGLNRHLNPTTVANKTAIWQLEVPMSVTPDSVLYPETLAHYPFADQAAEVCTYVVTSQTILQTPMIIGPTPVETLAIINSENIFEDQI